MKKLVFVLVSLLGAFVLGTNFHLEFNLSVGLLRSSGLRRMISKMQVRFAREEKPVQPAPKPVAPAKTHSRPSVLTGTPPRAGGWGHASNTTGLRPSKPPVVIGSTWDSVKGRWLPPGLKMNPAGGWTWPEGKKESDWDYLNGAWKTNPFAPKPFSGNLFPKKEEKPINAAIRYTGGDYSEYADDDEIIDNENDPL